MIKFKVSLTAIVRFVVLAGGIFFHTAFLCSEAISCPADGASAKQTFVSKEKSSDLTEEFSFAIQNFKMNHQDQANNLNINFRYCYEPGIAVSKYPDFRVIVKDIQDLLENYPNSTDYWEIVNKNVTQMVLKKYSMLSSVTNEIQVSPSDLVPFLRSSIVTRNRRKK